MSSRIVKQVIYGLFYSVILGSTIVGVYFIFFRPAPDECLDIKNQEICAIKKLASLKVLPIQIFSAGNTTTAFIKVQNVNLEYAVKNFSYEFNLYDKEGTKIFSFNGESFVYATDISSFVLPALEIQFSRVARFELLIMRVDWARKDIFVKPDTAVNNVVFKIDKGQLVIDADFLNNNLYNLSKVSIGVLLALDNGLLINASRTVLGSVAPLGVKHFKIFVPLSASSPNRFTLSNFRFFIDAKK